MPKAEMMTVNLVCSKCKRRNYTFRRNKRKKKKGSKKLELKKYCRFCRKQTVHKEGK